MKISEQLRQAAMYFDVQRYLEAHGWKQDREKTKRSTHGKDTVHVYNKSYSGVWLEVSLDDSLWNKDLVLSPSYTSLQRIPDFKSMTVQDILHTTKRDDLLKSLEIERWQSIPFDSVEQQLESKAQELAKKVKAAQAPPKKRDTTEFTWHEETGSGAFKKWQAAVEKEILDMLDRAYRYGRDLWTRARDTKTFTYEIGESNYFQAKPYMNPPTMNKLIMQALDRLSRQKKIEKLLPRDTGKSQVLWIKEPKDATQPPR